MQVDWRRAERGQEYVGEMGGDGQAGGEFGGSVSWAWAFATVAAWRTTVPSGRSVRVAAPQGQGWVREWALALARW